MKRAFAILTVAVVALVLVYPATAPSAKPPGPQDIPTIHIVTPYSPGGDDPANSGADGDADDLAGRKDGKTNMDGVSGQPDVMNASLAVRLWRLYMFTFRLY